MKIVVMDDWNHFFPTQPALDQLKERGEVVLYHDKAMSDQAVIDRLRGAAIAISNRERTHYNAKVLEALPDLELISHTGRAGPNLDVKTATARGIAISVAPGVPEGSSAVAELGLGLLLSLARQIPSNDQRVRTGDWAAPATEMLNRKTMGILGLGKIGRAMARMAQALEMSVIAWGPTLTPERAAESNVEYVAFDELFRRADALFVAPILSDLTRGIVGKEQLAAMKPTSYVINIARGPIIDEAALIDALQNRRIAGAGLDVFDTEPLPVDHPLVALDNVVLTPHIGWITTAQFSKFVAGVVQNILNYLDGNPTEIVNPEALAVPRSRVAANART